MTSQAVYCLSLQIRPPVIEESNATDSGKSNEPSPRVSGSSSIIKNKNLQSLDKMHSDTDMSNVPPSSSISQLQATVHPQHSNIILVRGARTENGQIILQNSHELLSLLNDDDKPILLQHQRIKAKNGGPESGAIIFQPALKATNMDSPIILQTQSIKKNVIGAASETTGSIFLQQRFSKAGGNDGPILLQTLKRLDKTQPILVFRSASSTATTTATTTSAKTQILQIGLKTTTTAQSVVDDGSEEMIEEPPPFQTQKHGNIPLGTDGEPIKLPENLESLPRADHFPILRHRWNTNEEIAAILISFDKHSEWQSKEVKTRPKSGSMLLYSRKKVRYRRDGYCWKKRKDGKTTREDHMKLKVQGTECIYGCYVHSAILPTFHRRCYWLLQNPDIVLVHYLNVPYPDDNKMAVIPPNLSLWGDKKEWTKEELFCQLKPMFFSEDEPDASNEIEISKAETVEAIVGQLMEKQRSARQAALVKQLECGCPDSTCADGKSCSHPMRRITAAKTPTEKRNENNNQVSSTTPNVLIGQRIYPRWMDRRSGRGGGGDHGIIQDLSHSTSVSAAAIASQNNLISNNTTTTTLTTITATPTNKSTLDNSSIVNFQVIPTTSHSNISNQTSIGSNLNLNNSNTNNSSNNSSSNANSISNTQNINTSNKNGNHHTTGINTSNNNNNNNSNNSQQQIVNQNLNIQLNRNNNNNNNTNNNNQLTAHSNIQTNLTATSVARENLLQSVAASATTITTTSVAANANNGDSHQQQQQHHHHHHLNQQLNRHHNQQNNSHHSVAHHSGQNLIDGNTRQASAAAAAATTANLIANHNARSSASIVTSAPPLVLSLSQIQGHGGSLLILNGGQQQSFVCQPQQHQPNLTLNQQHQHHLQQPQHQQQHLIQHRLIKEERHSTIQQPSHVLSQNVIIPKKEAMDSSSASEKQQQQQQQCTSATYSTMSYTNNTTIDSPLKDNKEFHDSLQFFNETLDLSQEDIQKTLSANMPIGGGHHSINNQIVAEDTIPDINPMDFIDNCVVGVENVHGNDDDFVNLDAFDMLVEFPELELEIKNGYMTSSSSGIADGESIFKKSASVSTVNAVTNNEVFNITDYSPEWAYPEGGVKVLVTGPWISNSNYTVLFDSFPVPTTIVQSGVLRCYCPAHEVGLATLQVACDGFVISNSVIFEYKSPPKSEESTEGNTNDAFFKFSLIDRFENINDRLQIKSEPGETSEDVQLFKQPNFEDRLVTFCNYLSMRTWRHGSSNVWSTGYRGMTLLHFASALGYSKLVCAMLTWRSENSSVVLESEIDALSQDIEGYTPLMWACAKGHVETALMLCRWNSNALNVKNNSRQSPIDVAKKFGNIELIAEIEHLSNVGHNKFGSNSNPPPLASISTGNTFIYDSTNNFFNLNTSYNLFNSSSSSSSSSSSANNITISANNLKIQHSNSDSMGSLNTLTNINRSHDGVFLRPGAVSSSTLSPPGLRLTKRPSVDSGINVDIRSGSANVTQQQQPRPTGKGMRDLQKLSRFDRSMSLPISNSPLSSYGTVDSGIDSFSLSIDSSMEGGSSSCNTTLSSLNTNCLSSPLRKMDFALCEVSAGDTSPIGNHQSASEDEDDVGCNQEGDNNTQECGGSGGANSGVVGESDAKVLTLAEQIIAAMPDRIKNESEELMSLGSPIQESLSCTDPSAMNGLNDSFMEPLLDSMSNSHFEHEYNFEFSDHNYRYHDVGTPCSSLSPASSGPLQSPASYSIPQEPLIGSPSPPPTTEDFTEFLHASNSTPKPFEADFSNLTLTDREQRELYEAAKCIQKAYRSYKGRKKLEEQDKERTAAIVIQNYYRRYKKYAYYRQATHAALVIQNGYRSYCENKRFKKSQCQNLSNTQHGVDVQETSSEFQTYYKNFQSEHQNQNSNSPGSSSTSKEPSPSGPLKRTYSQRTQNQAARKIQQFMRQSKLKLQRERAEKEKLVHQHRAEYHRSLQYQGHHEGLTRDQNNEDMLQSNVIRRHSHHIPNLLQSSQQQQQHIFSEVPTEPTNLLLSQSSQTIVPEKNPQQPHADADDSSTTAATTTNLHFWSKLQ